MPVHIENNSAVNIVQGLTHDMENPQIILNEIL